MTTFTDLVGCRLPLQLAGMGGGTSDVALVTAVCEAGGLGMIGAGGLPAPVVGQLLDAMTTDMPFGVNFLMPFLDREAVAMAAPRVRVVEFFYGEPDIALVKLTHEGGALAAWQVGSSDEARAAVDAGCDFVVVQGAEGGGHIRGTKPLADVLAATLAVVSIPVVASGGIGTARDVRTALDAGAAGVRVGTRFLAATESNAHPEYVDALLAASADDTVITEAFGEGWPGAPHRVLRSCIDAAKATQDDVVGTFRVAGMEIPVAHWSPMTPTSGVTGNVKAMALYAGTSVDAVLERKPAADIVAELCSEVG